MQELNELVGCKERRFAEHHDLPRQRKRPWKTVPAVVQKIVKSIYQDQLEKVEISIPAAGDLFREIRIENNFASVDGGSFALTNGAHLDVTFEAETKDPG